MVANKYLSDRYTYWASLVEKCVVAQLQNGRPNLDTELSIELVILRAACVADKTLQKMDERWAVLQSANAGNPQATATPEESAKDK